MRSVYDFAVDRNALRRLYFTETAGLQPYPWEHAVSYRGVNTLFRSIIRG